MKREGWVRCEISVRQNDVPLLRTVAAVLSDPAREAMARAVIRESFEMPSSLRLKGLLAAAPLGEMDGEALRAGGRWGRPLMFLIGPDVIAELAMGDRCDAGVAAWYAGVDEADLYLSVVVTGEVRRVIELARFRDRQRAVALERWLHEVERGFGDRVLPVDARVADAWGKINAIGPIPAVDGLLAATATTYDLTLVVRDAEQVEGLGAEVFSPFGS